MKVLLLDMDGVILHQPNIHRIVSIRATSFVCNTLREKIPNISFHHADTINRHLYTTYGHTLTGLNKVFHVNKTIDDFNRYVYDDITMNYVPNFQDDALIFKRSQNIQKLLDKCAKNKVPVYVFSNAPNHWCKLINNMMHLSIASENIIGSDHPFFADLQLMKPMPHLYYKMDDMIKQRYKDVCETIFVDDTLINLIPSISMKYWKSVLLCPNSPPMDAGSFHIRQSISNIIDLV